MPFFAALAPLLGTALGGGTAAKIAGTVGATLLGNAIDRRKDQNSMADRWNYMDKQGLTPQEIAGSAAAGGIGSSGSAQILGNQMQAAQQQQTELDFLQGQKDLDRKLIERGQDMGLLQTQTAAAATLGAARTSIEPALGRMDFQNALDQANALLASTKEIGEIQRQDQTIANDIALLVMRADSDIARFGEITPYTMNAVKGQIAKIGLDAASGAGKALLQYFVGRGTAGALTLGKATKGSPPTPPKSRDLSFGSVIE